MYHMILDLYLKNNDNCNCDINNQTIATPIPPYAQYLCILLSSCHAVV